MKIKDMEINIVKEKMMLEELEKMWLDFPYGKRIRFSHDFNKNTCNAKHYIRKFENGEDKKLSYNRLKTALYFLKKHIEEVSPKIVIQWSDYRYDLREVEVVEKTDGYTIFKDLSRKNEGEKKFATNEIEYGEDD